MAGVEQNRLKRLDYFWKEKLLFKTFGISFEENDSILYKIYSICWISLMNIGLPFITTIGILNEGSNVPYRLVSFNIGEYIGLVKTVVLLKNRIKIGKVLNKLQQKPFIANFDRGGETEELLIASCRKIINVQTMVSLGIGTISVAVTILIVIYKRIMNSDFRKWLMPYGPIPFINVNSSPNYEATCIYQVFGLYSIFVHFIGFDLIITGVLAHITYQFKMLQNNLKRCVVITFKKVKLDMENKEVRAVKDNASVEWKYWKLTIKEILNYHLSIIDIAEEMEAVCSISLLITILGTLSTLGLFLCQVAMISYGINMGEILCDSIATCMQVLFVCYWGEEVMFESQAVGRVITEINFVGSDSRFQKALTMIIMRSRIPVQLTAGKFAAISLATFVWMIRASYSAFMVLLNNSKTKLEN